MVLQSIDAQDTREDQPQDHPVPLPGLERFSSLWERSLFTTREAPVATAAGPSFADGLALAGVYELDGSTRVVLMSKDGQEVFEVVMGQPSANGIQIVNVEPGVTPDRTRVQLQKGAISGWVAFSEPTADSALNQPPASIAGKRQSFQRNSTPAMTSSVRKSSPVTSRKPRAQARNQARGESKSGGPPLPPK